MSNLFLALCSIVANPPAVGTYVDVLGHEMQYIGKVDAPDVDHVNVAGHVFILD